jgi:DNA-binding NtrC family response regulator
MNIASTIVSVYSKSLGERDYLRNLINACGFNAICFETENTFIDNLNTIKPKMAIVQTDSADCVWRFLFSIHASGLRSPMILLSLRLNAERFNRIGHGILIHAISNHRQGGRLSSVISGLATHINDDLIEDTTPLFIGESEETSKIRSRLPNIAHSHDAVLILGEQGTGKELLSRIIVEASSAHDRLIKIDCSKLESRVLVNGAMRKIFHMECKSKSITVLFDKIHQISMELQADLLLLVEEAQKLEAGKKADTKCRVRFIATSEHKIETLVQKGTFRKDLSYRLNVIPLSLPPLRYRRADIPLLMDYFIIDACVKNNKSVVIPSQKAREISFMYHWPGNVDELSNYMHRVAMDGNESCILNNSNIQKSMKNSGDHLLKAASVEELPKAYEIKDFIPTAKNLSLRSICDEFVSRTERRLMRRALDATNWNRKKAAELLNISYKSMLNKMKAYDII